jgi:hypothetical protein
MIQSPLKMFVIHAKYQHGGFYLALVPASLDETEMESAFQELDIDPDNVCEISDWRTTSQNVAAAYLPFPAVN